MNSTTKDLRYLEAKDKFLGYSYLAVGHHFCSHDQFICFFNAIENDDLKSLFLRTSSFYLFMVKNGNWIVSIPGLSEKIEYINNTYKFVGIFSLIESLSQNRHFDFYQYMIRKKSDVQFPINARSSIDRIYSSYKDEFGSIKRCIKFFNELSPKRQNDLIEKLKMQNVEPSIENFAKYLYGLRSKFVHDAEFVHHMSSSTSVSWKNKKSIVCKLSIHDAMLFFEEGLICHFRNKT